MIFFKKVRWKNLLSTGNMFTEISLSDHKTTLILGENGSGKSTILDAICFALFGKAFRKINKPSLINSINDKDCVVELEFETNGKEYRIVRGMKPTVFEIYQDDILLNQDAKSLDYQAHLEKNILKMNYKSFTQIDILGAASFTPFMQLTAADRRVVIEDLLDIQIFSIMNVLIKQKMQANKESSTDAKFLLTSGADKIKYIENTLKSLKLNDSTKIEKLKAELEIHQFEYQALLSQKNTIEDEMNEVISNSSSTAELKARHSKLIGLKSKIESNLARASKDIVFYSENDSCPTCKQIIDSGFKDTVLHETEDKLHVLGDGIKQIDLEIDDVINSLNETDKILSEIQTMNSKIKNLEIRCENKRQVMSKTRNDINDLSNVNSIYKDNEKLLADTKADMRKLIKEQSALLDEKQYLEIALTMLKDGGIKTRIIKQYLPIINKQINKYLKSMDFFIEFVLDENFDETIKSRHMDVYSYDNFSQGEKSRIDLALLFTWRHIAKLKNSVSTNLLILDEVFDGSLDGTGQEELMKILSVSDKSTNIFVISHTKEHLADKFDNVLKFEKEKGFSVLKGL